ncbi:transcription factor SPT20 homolog isoform X2 [Drosophila subobscura]|uniref:transcription factor SPT20 homolog isoform X2 n=1 Tax=Drosophila subobscura TaxID=7241 RepID=UPI00155B1A12|nr:transcription factor SPT20 homolog isoform X2 [Drosophila subobscura]
MSMWIPSGFGRWSFWLLPLAFAACLLPFTQATAPQGPAGPIPDNGKRNSRGNSSGLLADSQLSASERSRRLIPYMAFYLPAPELPINQQYAAKHSASAGGAQLQAPSVGRIPVPLAYMPQQQQQHQKQQLHHPQPHHHHASHYQSGAGEVYHTLAIGSHQHPHAHAHGHPPHPPPGQGKEHLTDSGATFIAYKPLNPTHKHKTVQHFPPLPAQKEQQQQLQYPTQYELVSPQYHQRQRAKQSKINLTPFTAQNTLPGQFVPIIYTPVSSNDQQQQQHNGNTINYNNNKPEIVYEDATPPHKNSHQTQIVADYAAAVASAEQQSAEEQQQQQQQQQQPEEEQQPPPPSSPAPPQYIDYLIDGPRQSLDEEQQQQLQHPHEPSQAAPPQLQHAYILVTTTAPHTDHQPAGPNLQRHPDISTPRPAVIYKQQPTLRLQPVHTYKATRRPVYVTTPAPTPSHTVEITPKYVYVSSKANKAVAPAPPPSPSREPSTVTPIKLKPVYKYAHERPPLTPAVQGHPAVYDDQLPDIRTSSLAEILHKLQASNHLPQTLTPDNIDNSIKTLIRILQNLKQTQTIASSPPQHHETKHSGASHEDYDYNTDSGEDHATATSADKGPNKHPGPSTGRAGIDYPNYSVIPQTSFECTKQRYKGFFGDPETNCQVWHYCDLNGGKASFLCPNGTIFSQIALTCDWWFNVKCSTTAQLYVLNERLYKYILPFNPKFPEDYNGPIVDKYLAMKFQEMEEKMRQEKQRKTNEQAEKPVEVAPSTPALPKNHKPSPKHGSGINAQVYEQSSERNLLIDDEIDDISERGSYDTYDQAPTTVMSPTSTQGTQQSFVLRPIVVSSTPQPEADFDVEPTALLQGSEEQEQEQEQEDKLQSLRDTKAAEQKQGTTRVSVEKLEVIEIKTDGDTGQLMPIKESGE